MKLSFGCLIAVLGSAVTVANENEKPFVPISTVVSSNKFKMKKTIHSPPSAFNIVKGTHIYKQLSHQAYVRDHTNRMENDKSVADADSDAGFDVDMKVNKKEAAGTTVAVSAVATTTTAVVSGEEVCVPPVTVTKTSNLDAGHLPLSSCSSKKQICVINSNNKKESTSSSSSFIEKIGVCLDPWDLPPSYSGNKSDPNNRDVSSTSHKEDPSYTDIAAMPSTHKEDDSFYKEYHADVDAEDGSYDAYAIIGDYPGDINYSNYYDNHMYEQDHGDRPYATDRHLQDNELTCDEKCPNGRPTVNIDEFEFDLYFLIRMCLGGDYICLDCVCPEELIGININCWDVSEITNMANAFNDGYDFVRSNSLDFTNFDQPLDCWDTSSVTTMTSMFEYAVVFNQNIDSWDTRKVVDMSRMFLFADSFNQCLSTWATKTDNVDTNQMLDGSDCSDPADPDPNDGPWCQTVKQCEAIPIDTPTESPTDPITCKDDKKIKFIVGEKAKKCNILKVSQCDEEYETKSGSKEKPKDFCFKLCDPNCLCVEDKKKKYKFKMDGKTKKLNCKKIKKKLCGTNLKNKGTLGKDVCPKSCKVKNCK